MAGPSEPQGGRVRAGAGRHPGLLGHRGHLLVAVALILLTIATGHAVALGARSAGATLACAVAWLTAWVVIER